MDLNQYKSPMALKNMNGHNTMGRWRYYFRSISGFILFQGHWGLILLLGPMGTLCIYVFYWGLGFVIVWVGQKMYKSPMAQIILIIPNGHNNEKSLTYKSPSGHKIILMMGNKVARMVADYSENYKSNIFNII